MFLKGAGEAVSGLVEGTSEVVRERARERERECVRECVCARIVCERGGAPEPFVLGPFVVESELFVVESELFVVEVSGLWMRAPLN